MSKKIEHWKNFYVDWLTTTDRPSSILIVHYENIVSDLELTSRRILKFLNFEADENRIQCLLRSSEGKMKRKHIKSREGDPYTPNQRKRIRNAIQIVDGMLRHYGKETLPLHKYELMNDA